VKGGTGEAGGVVSPTKEITNKGKEEKMRIGFNHRGVAGIRHTAEGRCPGRAKRGLAPQEIFHCEAMKNINVCDASFCIRKNWIPAFAGMTGGKCGMIGKICVMTLIVITALFAIPSYATDAEDRKTVTSKKYVNDQIATKQPILNANGTDLRNNVVMYTNQAGEVTSKPISTTLSGTGIDNNLPTVGAVNTGLATKQNEIGAGTASGNVVTYTGSPGTVGEKPVYNSNATYNQNALIEANHANSAIRTGLNNHLTCAGTQGENGPCWLWQINDQAVNTVYTPHNN